MNTADRPDVCKFGAGCRRVDTCKFAHPFVCLSGVKCGGCKLEHPPKSSVMPVLPGPGPQATRCRYKTACSAPACKFAHPDGHMAVPREPARVFVTHSHTLQKLAAPVPLALSVPDTATHFSFQGEFAMFFTPYPGTWAKRHFQTVAMHRWDSGKQAYRLVGHFSLDRHYCNSVAAYLVFSFWPYDEEAVRTIWDSLRMLRTQEKELRALRTEVQTMRADNAALRTVLAERDRLVASLQLQLGQAVARQEAAVAEAAAARRSEQAMQRTLSSTQQQLWSMQQQLERERAERLRLRDPILVYALSEGADGFNTADWTLVLDYHKGAHRLELGPPEADGSQVLDVTEHDNTYRFSLVVPRDVRHLARREPLRPSQLCEHF